MKKQITTFLAVWSLQIAFLGLLHAQSNLLWTQTNNVTVSNGANDYVTSMTNDASGIYVTGVRATIEKRDKTTGAVIWTQTGDVSTMPTCITADASGIYVGGIADTYGYGYVGMIEKRDLNTGAVIWTQYSLLSTGFDDIWSITADASGVYVAGHDNNLGSSNAQWHIEKRDLNTGAIIWSQLSNTSSNNEWAQAITVDASGIYVAGNDRKFGVNSPQWRIEKRNLSTGAISWTRTVHINGNGNDNATAITADASGVYVAGKAAGLGCVKKLSLSKGTVIWSQSGAAITNGASDDHQAITADASGIYVTGGGGVWNIEKRNLSTGSLICSQTYDPSSAVNVYADLCNAITSDASGIYVGGGDYSQGVAPAYDGQWRINKYEKCAGSREMLSVESPSLNSIYPNPSSGKFTIKNDELSGESYEVEIYNVMGEKVYSITNPSINQSAVIDISSQCSGVYFLNIKTDKEMISEKIVIQK